MTTTTEDHDTSTAQSEAPTSEKQTEATKRFRMASFIQRTGSRAQKRAVAAGKVTKNLAIAGAKATWDQIALPYTGLKLGAMAVAMVAGAIALWYLAIMAMLVTLAGTGSVILAILACAVAYVLMARFLYIPLLTVGGTYFGNAQLYKAQPKGMHHVGTIRTTAFG